ncbi:hypothetical protein [Clostridium sp. AF22-10]|uniref:hypothetical protein n=1 Tax=Clostridium sp. AF22-10 TaxID=2293004 RepID=UPI000E4C053D|nr:hypothetical protein DWX91_14215 [Clostridium sp. AF22-10]
MEEYNGDIIRLDRLIEFLPDEFWIWDETENITLEDISVAIHDGLPEVNEPYRDTWKHPALEKKSREWHIGRIIYFINHPTEIRDIYLEEECWEGFILPSTTINDGWHRYAAARWLYDQGKMSTVHCQYGGREDILDYLKGTTDEYLMEAI